jgi:hypothetical protein
VAGYESEGASSTSSSYRPPRSVTSSRLVPGDAASLQSSVELVSLDGRRHSAYLEAAAVGAGAAGAPPPRDVRRLVGVVFRDPVAAMISLKLHALLPESTPCREEFMELLMTLLAANPRNKRLLRKNDGLIATLLALAFRDPSALVADAAVHDGARSPSMQSTTSSDSLSHGREEVGAPRGPARLLSVAALSSSPSSLLSPGPG